MSATCTVDCNIYESVHVLKDWYVYIVRCADDSLYTGVTTDINRRLYEHNNTLKGAKYTKSRRPVKVVYISSPVTRSEALKKEYAMKKKTKKMKETFLIEYGIINDNV